MWHEGEGERIVLICDMWPPDLEVTSLLPAMDRSGMEALAAAERGEHLPLLARPNMSTRD